METGESKRMPINVTPNSGTVRRQVGGGEGGTVKE